ncbi:HelD family protein [Micromonospora sp. NPDC050397]|uniref:HelD family protein n=1 Tax=Micromonospora sp. NPDC050397 TaxID=3364279 RepID=UPI0038517FF4
MPALDASSVPALDAELAREREYLARSRVALARMLDTARHRVATGAAVAGDRYTAETLGRMLRTHAKALAEEPESPLYFGRLDFGDTEAAGDHRGERYYIGRRHIGEPAEQPRVLDWRAPVSRAFYRASRQEPEGVTARRRFGWTRTLDGPAELTGFEDEHLTGGTPGPGREAPTTDRPSRLATTDGSNRLAAPDGLSRLVAAEIERPRVGPMRDIVATIQPEQDALVRAALHESVCVQGAPGTGKTAVGLHRAAYLLYTYSHQLKRSGVLIIGPNRAFLDYISAVLPALGEVDIAQRTLDDLVARHPVRAVDSVEAEAVKHDVRMAAVLRHALYSRVRTPTEPLVVPDGSFRWRVSAEALRRLVEEVRQADLPYGLGRDRLRSRIVDRLQRHAETREAPGPGWVRRISHCRPVNDLLARVWPAVRPEELVSDLLGQPELLASAAHALLDERERAAIAWPRPRTAKRARWSAADLVLLDEAAGLVERPEGFRHIVVDEAQDLSPMQCRVVARRSGHGSLTVLGDLAQATTAWAARSWREQLDHLGKPEAPVVPLTTGFRVPASVVELTNRLLATLAVDVPPTRSLRTDGELRLRAVPDLGAAVTVAVADALTQPGSIAVIAAGHRVPALTATLKAAGIDNMTVDGSTDDGSTDDDTGHGRDHGGARVTVLPATMVKGLEYDHVIAVEPAEIVDGEPRGANRLYVVLTRAVSRLDVLHSRPLPPVLVSAGGRSCGGGPSGLHATVAPISAG